MRLFGILVCVLCLAAPLQAQDAAQAHFEVRLENLKLGEMILTGTSNATAYAARARLVTSGLAGALARVRFDLDVKGRMNGHGPAPQSYAEEIHTGQRHSTVQLRYEDGIPILVAGDRGTDGPVLDPSEQRGVLDPLTVLFLALMDQPEERVCTLDKAIYDGARRSQINLTARAVSGTLTICTGSFRRIAGYTEKELARFRSLPVRVEYAPQGNIMRAVRVQVQTVYGNVVLHRR